MQTYITGVFEVPESERVGFARDLLDLYYAHYDGIAVVQDGNVIEELSILKQVKDDDFQTTAAIKYERKLKGEQRRKLRDHLLKLIEDVDGIDIVLAMSDALRVRGDVLADKLEALAE